jgi:hypothetical protein
MELMQLLQPVGQDWQYWEDESVKVPVGHV